MTRCPPSASHPARERAGPARVAAIYLLSSLSWIWLSDRVLLWIGVGGEAGFWIAALKGTFFVALSALVLYWLIRREMRALTDALTLLRAVTESATDAIFVKDRGGKYLLCNQAGAEMVGKSVGEVLGEDDAALFNAQSARRVQEHDRLVMDSATAQTRESELTAGGSTRIYFVTKVPYRDASGAVIGVIGISRDITERKRAEEALRQSELRYRLISELTSDYVYSIKLNRPATADELVSAANPFSDYESEWVTRSFTSITGYEWDEVLAQGGWSRIIHPDDLPRLKPVTQGLLRGESGVVEYRIRTKGGDIRWLRDAFRPVWDEKEGRVVRLYGAVKDITERRQLEEQLRQSQKMEAVGRLAGGVAHDFNNLLTVINGYSDLVLRGLSPTDPQRDPLAHIRAAGERAARLTKQLLAYGRKAMVEPRVLDLNDLISESTKLLGRLIGEDVVVVSALQPGLDPIKVDRGQIEQVLMNLALNARDAMPTGGRITIETSNVGLSREELPDPELEPGRYVRLTVADTGTGMTEAVKAHIFEPFFTTKEQGKGTGLGLAVVHGAVKQSGGHIGVESKPGLGATFTILFPTAEDNPQPLSELIKRAPRGTETVLLVEDEDAVRMIARVGLENEGYTVLAAGGATEALGKIEAHGRPIDLLVTDVVMPQMGGRQLAEALRTRQPDLRVLYVSGYTDDVVVRHGLAEPAGDFLQKPFTTGELARKVRELIDRR